MAMDLLKVIAELRENRDCLDAVIMILEPLDRGRTARRPRPGRQRRDCPTTTVKQLARAGGNITHAADAAGEEGLTTMKNLISTKGEYLVPVSGDKTVRRLDHYPELVRALRDGDVLRARMLCARLFDSGAEPAQAVD